MLTVDSSSYDINKEVNIIITQKTFESNITNIFLKYIPNSKTEYNDINLYEIIKSIARIRYSKSLSYEYISILKFLNDNYKESLKNNIYLIRKNKELSYIKDKEYLDSDNIIDFDFVFSNIDENIINK